MLITLGHHSSKVKAVKGLRALDSWDHLPLGLGRSLIMEAAAACLLVVLDILQIQIKALPTCIKDLLLLLSLRDMVILDFAKKKCFRSLEIKGFIKNIIMDLHIKLHTKAHIRDHT